MSLYVGNTEIKDLYYGNKSVSAYCNGEWIWPLAKQIKFLTLQTDGHGTLTADTLSGYEGDTIELEPTYNTYYRFNNYSVTGGTVNGNTFTFGTAENATAKANFKVNSFTAAGKFNQLSHGSLGQCRNHIKWATYVTAASNNVPSNWKKPAGLSYNSASSGYSTAYYGSAYAVKSYKDDTWCPTGTISGYVFSAAINSTAHHDYARDTITAFNFRLYQGPYQSYSGNPYGIQYPASTPPTTAKTNYIVSASGTNSTTGYQWVSGFVGCSRSVDNDGLCTSLGTINGWSASGIIP